MGTIRNFFRITAIDETKLKEGMIILDTMLKESYMDKKITILGAGGRMGKWFANYFSAMDFEVTGFDSENEVKGKICN